MEHMDIETYLNEYKDIPFEKEPLNEIDYLFFSFLAYANILGLNYDIKYPEFCDMFLKQQISKERYGSVVPKLVDVLTVNMNAKRYKDVIIKNYIYLINNDTQFGAMVFSMGKKAVVAFTGSDGSVIGWYENLRCAYMYPIYSQIRSKEYLSNIIDEYDEIVITGHSKGGNLAMSSAMGLDEKYLDKIKGIYNFDGQGFFEHILESTEYKNIESKIINFLPEDSYIGVLLYHGGTMRLVKTNCSGIGVHFQYNWRIDDKTIVCGEKQTVKSKYIHEITTKRLARLDKEEMNKVIENAIDALEIDRTQKLKVGLMDLVNIIKLNQTDKIVTKRDFKAVLKAFLLIDKLYKNNDATKSNSNAN